MTKGEFSVAAALAKVGPLRDMLQSNQPGDQKLADAIVRDAAILTLLTQRLGPFKGPSP